MNLGLGRVRSTRRVVRGGLRVELRLGLLGLGFGIGVGWRVTYAVKLVRDHSSGGSVFNRLDWRLSLSG